MLYFFNTNQSSDQIKTIDQLIIIWIKVNKLRFNFNFTKKGKKGLKDSVQGSFLSQSKNWVD